MAEKRMFTQKIVDSDDFTEMPLSSQALYFHLNMAADDDGFINNPKKIQRGIGASVDDLKLLIAKRFVICFENGVVVIKHWRMHNTLKKDRYKPTPYQEQLALLEIKENKAYTEKAKKNDVSTLEPEWNQNGTRMEPQYSIDYFSKDQISKDKNIMHDSDESEIILPKKTKHKYGEYNNVLLTDEELQKLQAEYPDCEERIERLSSYIASTGKAYKSHYATIRNWARKDAERPQQQQIKKTGFNNYSENRQLNDFERRMLEKRMNPPATAGTDENIMQKVVELKKKLGTE